MPERRGLYTITLSNQPTILGRAAVVGKKEGEGKKWCECESVSLSSKKEEGKGKKKKKEKEKGTFGKKKTELHEIPLEICTSHTNFSEKKKKKKQRTRTPVSVVRAA